jgi:hypothetical protein
MVQLVHLHELLVVLLLRSPVQRGLHDTFPTQRSLSKLCLLTRSSH